MGSKNSYFTKTRSTGSESGDVSEQFARVNAQLTQQDKIISLILAVFAISLLAISMNLFQDNKLHDRINLLEKELLDYRKESIGLLKNK